MSAEHFLDTNILVYMLDETDDLKRHRAEHLVQTSIESGAGCISYQVVQETLNVTTRKLGFSANDARILMANVPTASLDSPAQHGVVRARPGAACQVRIQLLRLNDSRRRPPVRMHPPIQRRSPTRPADWDPNQLKTRSRRLQSRRLTELLRPAIPPSSSLPLAFRMRLLPLFCSYSIHRRTFEGRSVTLPAC